MEKVWGQFRVLCRWKYMYVGFFFICVGENACGFSKRIRLCCTLIRELIVPNFTKILCQPFGNCDTQLLLICVAKSRKIMESWRVDEARQHLEQRIEMYTSSKGLCFRHDLPLYPIIALLKNFIRSHWLSSAPRGLH